MRTQKNWPRSSQEKRASRREAKSNDRRKDTDAGTMLKDGENYPALSDVIKDLGIGRTAFYRYFSPRTDLQAKATELKSLERMLCNKVNQHAKYYQ